MELTPDETQAVITAVHLELENMADSEVEIANVELLQSALNKLEGSIMSNKDLINTIMAWSHYHPNHSHIELRDYLLKLLAEI